MDLLGFEYSQQQKYDPAPKEEDMEFAKTTCAGCGATLLNLETCQRCAERTAHDHARSKG